MEQQHCDQHGDIADQLHQQVHSEIRHRLGNQAENCIRRQHHDQADHLDHDFVHDLNELNRLTGLLADHQQADAEQDREKDDRQHLSLRHGVDRIARDDADQHFGQWRCFLAG